MKKRKSTDNLNNPDDAETQPLVAGERDRTIPRSMPPDCLAEVLSRLQTEDIKPFDHTLQYKQQFRALVKNIQEGTPCALMSVYVCSFRWSQNLVESIPATTSVGADMLLQAQQVAAEKVGLRVVLNRAWSSNLRTNAGGRRGQ